MSIHDVLQSVQRASAVHGQTSVPDLLVAKDPASDNWLLYRPRTANAAEVLIRCGETDLANVLARHRGSVGCITRLSFRYNGPFISVRWFTVRFDAAGRVIEVTAVRYAG